MHRMDMRSREQYLKALLGRYLRVRKRGKSALLDEYCRNTGMARKSVLRKIAGLLKGESPPRKDRRPVYGKVLLILQPGETRHVESRSAKTSYAQWSSVVFSNDNKVHFDKNKVWEWPWPGMLALEALNVDGTATEGLAVAGQFWYCYRGIPKFIPVSINDLTWCFIERIERVWVKTKKLEGDYYVSHRELKWVKTERSKKEIRAIEKELEDAAVEKVRREVQQSFLKTQETAQKGPF